MKKILLILAIAGMGLVANAQAKFEVKDFGKFKLHTYVTADPLGDMTYIIEGKKSLVVLEPAAFHDNINEFGQYLERLNKPVEKVIVNYHVAGGSAFDHSLFVMVEGMPEFSKGEIYGGMIGGFSAGFGDATDTTDFTAPETVAKDAKKRWAGVDFQFYPGATSDFPAASILIGDKVYYLHFTPVVNMHMGALQITGREAVDAYLKELEHAKASRAITFIGGHGMGTADINAVDFQIAYLGKIKEVLRQQSTADSFIAAMKVAYPGIAGEKDLVAVATILYP